jgi:hypothetical protein
MSVTGRCAVSWLARLAMPAVMLALGAYLGPVARAQATPMVSIAPTHEGCSILAGQGWLPGDEVVVSVGQAEFHVQADEQGDFVQAIPLALGPGTDVVYSWRRQGDAAAISVARTYVSAGSSQAESDRARSICASISADGAAAEVPRSATLWDVLGRPVLIASSVLIIATFAIVGLRRATARSMGRSRR